MFNIGASLKNHREGRNLSQSELSRKVGISQQSLSRWENNENIPNIVDCLILAEFYGISVEYLVGYENEDGSKNPIK